MQKTLVIGKNYGAIFGLDPDKGLTLTYKGGDAWQASRPGACQDVISHDTTIKALEYINRPSVHTSATI